MKSWISPKARKGLPSKIHGKGLFAVADICKDEIVAVKGGSILTDEEISALPFRHLHPELQIAADLFVSPLGEEDLEESMAYVNHSCEPNLGMRGDIVGVAMRDIREGEEIVQDYAMIDAREYTLPCTCGTPACRGTVTGEDWKISDLQKKYLGYFSAYIAHLIAREESR